MYPVSQAFHNAVASGADQKALLLFDDAVFTNDDIAIDPGIELTEYFNADEDLTPGGTPSAELSFTLFNEEHPFPVQRSADVVWNQLVVNDSSSGRTNNGVLYTKGDSGEWIATETGERESYRSYVIISTINAPYGHKYFVTHGVEEEGGGNKFWITLYGTGTAEPISNIYSKYGEIITPEENPLHIGYGYLNISVSNEYDIPSGGLVFRPQVFDLTLMFGAGNEPETVEEFRKMCPLDYYEYDAGTQKTITWTEYENAPILSEYGFGKCRATIGVQVSSTTYALSSNEICRTYPSTSTSETAYYNIKTMSSNGKTIYVRSTALNVQPDFQPTGMIFYRSITAPYVNLYAFDENGNVWYANKGNSTSVASSGWSVAEVTLNEFMKEKLKRLASHERGYCYNESERTIIIGDDETLQRMTYECCPLGVFDVERPKVSQTSLLQITANDQMMLFDKDIPSDLFTYPTTIGGLLTAMCDEVGVICDTTSFINMNATIASKPSQFDTATMRNVLQWIAQASCSIAKFNRDGHLELRWLNHINVSFDEGDYDDFQPYYYETPTVDKFVYRDTSASDKVCGSGDCAFLIQDNPLLKDATTESSPPQLTMMSSPMMMSRPRIEIEEEQEGDDEDADS